MSILQGMRKRVIKQSSVMLWMLLLLPALWAQPQSPEKWKFSIKELETDKVELIFDLSLPSGWHIYSQHTADGGPIATEFLFDSSNDYVRVGSVNEPKPHVEMDDVFQVLVSSFEGNVRFRQIIKRKVPASFKVSGTMNYQLCNDGSCIPPDEVPFEFIVPEVKAEAEQPNVSAAAVSFSDTIPEDVASTPDSLAQVVTDSIVAEQPKEDTDSAGRSLWMIFLIALGSGIVVMFTPCVFPMIPMTVNFFMHGSDNKRKNRRQALMFGLSIILIFTVVGAVLTFLLGPESLNFIATHWLPNIIFFVIFFTFSLSFFGLFEIRMPEKWINKSDTQADKGGFLAPFFIALTTVLVSFSCTGPIIGAALVGLTTSTTQRMVSLVTMLGFGVGFALPFTLLALFPGAMKNMRSGSWLNTVKVCFAFLELAFGLKFLQMADLYCEWHLLNRDFYLALWIVIFGLMGLYLLGKFRFKDEPPVEHLSVLRLFVAILTLSFTVWMIPGLWGAPLKLITGFLPPMDTQEFKVQDVFQSKNSLGAETIFDYSGGANESSTLPIDRKYVNQLHMPLGYEGFYDLDEAKAYARAVNKPIFIDFTGRNCANCRTMEQAVWSNKDVMKLLNDEFIICAVYTDMNSIKLPESEWIKDNNGRTIKTLGRKNLFYQSSMYNVNAQPYYVIIDSDGKVQTQQNYGYDKKVDHFMAFLSEGLATFRQNNKN